MAIEAPRGVWKQLDGLFRFGAAGPLGDDELLGRYVSGRRGADDEEADAEAAFAAMVERHGPMVLGVCRRVLGDRHAAEDAFQATFLVLARRAGSIGRREQLASWLHGVASRVALDARARDDRRRARERRAAAMAATEVGPDDAPDRMELRAVLDEELARLPAPYRGAVVLCELDGLSRQAAAQRLGIPEGTLSSRLARARDLLRHRLTRRGLAPSVSIVAIEAAARQSRAVLIPPSLAGSTIRAAARVAAGAPLAEAVSASVVTLTQGALSAMSLAKIKGLAFGAAAAAVVTTGVGVLAQAPAPRPAAAPAEREERLDAMERKLDRILEALGTRPAATRTRPADPFAANPTQPSPAAGTRSQAAGPSVSTPDPGEELVTEEERSSDRQVFTRPMVRPRPGPTEDRLADLERRLTALERRFQAMESRMDTAAGPANANASTRPARRPPFRVPETNLSRRGFSGAQVIQDRQNAAGNNAPSQGPGQPQGDNAGNPGNAQHQGQGQSQGDNAGNPGGQRGNRTGQGQNQGGGNANPQDQPGQGQGRNNGQGQGQKYPPGQRESRNEDPSNDPARPVAYDGLGLDSRWPAVDLVFDTRDAPAR